VVAPGQVLWCRRKKHSAAAKSTICHPVVTVTCHIGYGHVLHYITPGTLNTEHFSAEWDRVGSMVYEFRPSIGCSQTLHQCFPRWVLTDINLDSCEPHLMSVSPSEKGNVICPVQFRVGQRRGSSFKRWEPVVDVDQTGGPWVRHSMFQRRSVPISARHIGDGKKKRRRPGAPSDDSQVAPNFTHRLIQGNHLPAPSPPY